ncbi:manganese catalase family protein, partial [Burkholderia vietnamiensis]|uniref:manganese catalase family protein n=1 Tax=Burkholderia vietnamiensis TaxID=60552 RepID=UPI0039BFC1C6
MASASVQHPNAARQRCVRPSSPSTTGARRARGCVAGVLHFFNGGFMFIHNTRLQYTVRVDAPNPGLANLLLEQFGGPQGELAAAMRYFTQAVTEEDPGRKDMLFD